MDEIANIKDGLIVELWLPTARKGGQTFYPRRRVHKKMKLLTLTSHLNFKEVTEFIRNKITTKELIVGWNKSRSTAFRLDSEGKLGTVIPGARFEDCIVLDRHEIHIEFPFDIVNLDFSSQFPESEEWRLEDEIHSLEHTMRLQSRNEGNSMVLIYTTLMESTPLDLNRVKRNSDDARVRGWNGLVINALPSTVTAPKAMMKCLNTIIPQICAKYGYVVIEESGSCCKKMSDESKHILSIAALMRRSGMT